jgi:hypothetical protein
MLPDESFQLRLRYYDGGQIAEARKAYDVQMKSFETEILHIWDIIHVIYEDRKSPFKISDFNDLTLKTQEQVRKMIKNKTGEPLYRDIEKPWDGLNFVRPGETDTDRMNPTYLYEKENLSRRIAVIWEMIDEIYRYDHPVERQILEDQLNFLEKEYNRFNNNVNPSHIQPGLVLEADITSIKRKKFTLDAMSKALNEFLRSVSKGFQDASFRGRRITGSFTGVGAQIGFDGGARESAKAGLSAKYKPAAKALGEGEKAEKAPVKAAAKKVRKAAAAKAAPDGAKAPAKKATPEE